MGVVAPGDKKNYLHTHTCNVYEPFKDAEVKCNPNNVKTFCVQPNRNGPTNF